MDKEKVKLHTAPSQKHKILCQYCPAGAKPILVKNYKKHIEHYHKDKDPRNLRDKNTQSITRWTSGSLKRKCDSDSEARDSQTNVKRRHVSGDSGCGTGDDDDELLETGDRETVGALDSQDKVPVTAIAEETGPQVSLGVREVVDNIEQGLDETHVTFSEDLSHPIPSISPAKDSLEIDLKRQNSIPPSKSQSSSIFSDLESVLNQAFIRPPVAPSDHVMKLPREEMEMFGRCPTWDNFVLVICDKCDKIVKIEAFESHMTLRHGSEAEKSAYHRVLTSRVEASLQLCEVKLTPITPYSTDTHSSASLVAEAMTKKTANESGPQVHVSLDNIEQSTTEVKDGNINEKIVAAIGESQSRSKEQSQSQKHGDEATTVWREEKSEEENNPDPAATLSGETDESLGPPLVHNPAAALSGETDESLGPLLVHDPAAALSDGQDDREGDPTNDDLLKMLCELKLGQNRFQLNLDRIQESINKIRLTPSSETRPEESLGPLLVHDPGSALSEEVSAQFSIVKSIKAFEKLDFKYDESKESLCCNICEASFKYQGQHEFKDEILSEAFRNLKKRVKTHLLTQKHQNKVVENQQEEEKKKVFVSRNRQAGLNIGRIVYKNIALRQAKRDFEIDILNTSRAGGEVGNINHSCSFVLRLRPYLANAVRDKKRSFLSDTTLQTGCLPCMCFSADGATYKRECRHFQGKTN